MQGAGSQMPLSSNTARSGVLPEKEAALLPQPFCRHLPSKRHLFSVLLEIIHTLHKPGFLSLGTIDVLGCVTLCWGWVTGRLASSLTSAGDSAPPLGCDNQKYFPEGTTGLCLCVCPFSCLGKSIPYMLWLHLAFCP